MQMLERYRRNTSIRTLACAVFCVYLFAVLMHSLLYHGWTNWSGGAVYWISQRRMKALLHLLVMLLILLEIPYSWKRSLLVLAAVLVRRYIPAIGGGNDRMLELFILAILSNLGTRMRGRG